jgi:hypothetical protein
VILRGLSVLAAFVLLVGSASASGGWRHVTIQRKKGTIEATLSYDTRGVRGLTGNADIRRTRLVVRRAGKTMIDSPLPGGEIILTLTLRNVWGDAEPEALVDISSCGNRCSDSLRVALVDRPAAGRVLLHDFGAFWPGPHTAWDVQRHDGRFDFISRDQRFFCFFTDCASSTTPIQIFAIEKSGRGFADVTLSRPDLIAADAKGLWAEYLRQRASTAYNDLGVLAPWCADQYLLRRKKRCEQLIAHGYSNHGRPGNPSSVKLLLKKLLAWGYG